MAITDPPPLKTLLDKYHWPGSSTTQKAAIAPSAKSTLSDAATDTLFWSHFHDINKGETEQPEVPKDLIDQIVAVRQEVLSQITLPSLPPSNHEVNKKFSDHFPGSVVGPSIMFSEKRSSLVQFIVSDLQPELDGFREQESQLDKQLKEQEKEDPERKQPATRETAKKLQDVHVLWMKTMAFKHLMDGREGPSDAINTYDQAVFSWGMGWAGHAGALPTVLSHILEAEHKEAGSGDDRFDKLYIEKFFYLCGFMFNNGRFYVVNTEDRRVYSSAGQEKRGPRIDPATGQPFLNQDNKTVRSFDLSYNRTYLTIHNELALHSMWVWAARDELTRRVVYQAQKRAFMNGNAQFDESSKIATSALYTFLSHIKHWTGEDQHVIPNARLLNMLDGLTLPSEEADSVIAVAAVRRYFCHRLALDGALSQLIDYWTQMVGTDAKVDGATRFKPDLPWMTATPSSSPTTIPGDHAMGVANSKYYDMGLPDWYETGDPFDIKSKPDPNKPPKRFEIKQQKRGQGPASAIPQTGSTTPSPPLDETTPEVPLAPPPAPPPRQRSWYEWLWHSRSLDCFPAGTPIALPGGRSCAIEALGVGDDVLAYHEATREVVVATVRRCWHKPAIHFVRLSVDTSSEPLWVTPSHPFFTAGQWRPAGELCVGDALEMLDGMRTRTVLLTDVQLVEREPEPVYTLTVDPVPTFFAGGVLVHNKRD